MVYENIVVTELHVGCFGVELAAYVFELVERVGLQAVLLWLFAWSWVLRIGQE